MTYLMNISCSELCLIKAHYYAGAGNELCKMIILQCGIFYLFCLFTCCIMADSYHLTMTELQYENVAFIFDYC